MDYQKLNRTLTVVDNEVATGIYQQLKRDGFSEERAAALLYSKGLIDGKRQKNAAISKAYEKNQELRAEIDRLKAEGGHENG
jgi:hypothetical protein